MESALKPVSEILVPIDFSDCSDRALQYAMRLGASSNAHLHLLYVEDDPMLMQRSTDERYRDEQADKMSVKFVNVISADDRKRFRTTISVKFGTAYHEIETYAEENDIDLIVMGNIGRSAIADVLLGSVSKHVIRHAACPVCTVTHH